MRGWRAVLLLASGTGLLMPPRAATAGPERQKPLVPLAYVRRVVMTGTRIVTQPDAPLPARPPSTNKRALARWEQRKRAHDAFAALRAQAADTAGRAVQSQLAHLSGLVVAEGLLEAGPAWQAVTAPQLAAGLFSAEALAELAADGRAAKADAVIAVAMDRFGLLTAFDRELWVRIRAWLVPCDSRPPEGPFLCYGWSRTGRLLFTGRFHRTDDELVEGAARGAAAQLARVLTTGEESPFAGGVGLAFLPASVPQQVPKRNAENEETASIPLPSLIRQRDVLLQPEAGPAASVCSDDAITGALKSARLAPEDLWKPDGRPDLDAVEAVARRLRAGYVLVSRVVDAEVSQRDISVAVGGSPRPGFERQATVEAQACWVEVAKRSIVWEDRTTAESVARTEYIRGEARIRTDEQCVYDAARSAYAYLRSGFDQYRRHFER